MRFLRVDRVVAVGLSILCAALVAGTALGHAELDTMTPADKASVPSPTEIVATFTEPVDPAKSSLKLVDAGGKVVAEGSTVDAGDAKTMRLALTSLDPATYTVRWTTASALDGDLDHGTTVFTVTAAASVAPSSQPTDSSLAPSSEPPSAAPTTPTTAAPSIPPAAPAASSSDAVIPVIVALIVLAGLGLWLLRGRSRTSR